MCRTTWRPRRVVAGVEAERLEDLAHDPLVVLGLLEVLLPFLLQLVVLRAADPRL